MRVCYCLYLPVSSYILLQSILYTVAKVVSLEPRLKKAECVSSFSIAVAQNLTVGYL
jgi:hypothetical protein